MNDRIENRVSIKSLRKRGWSDLQLRPYQLEGVNWLLGCHINNHGCILGDEMGLGKTCQTIAMLTFLTDASSDHRPHLVVCPRSVLENWMQEFQKFSPGLQVMTYAGDKDTRSDLSLKIKKSKKGLAYCFDVLLTTYELCLKDFLFLQSVCWHVLVVDEAHRLKNCESLLYQTLVQWDIHCHVLLTGTPIQNNLNELYSLLAFIDRNKFKPSRIDAFVQKFTNGSNKEMEELHSILKPYLLRRTKANVLQDLPEKTDVIIYHGLSSLQKKLYKAILTKDLEAFENPDNPHQTRLMNILVQLRKCVNHPYLFDGVEPEPFEIGEHLVESSAKLVLIDRLLKWLHSLGHKVLLFSQMTHMLDILQDYLGYRGYTYERLDGSVRGEERFLAVQNFNQNDETFVFLLSTKAGGQGLNLTAADTVIFVDSDFNPQNDLQAAARAHRIGQNRPVKIIRLIGKNTVEEIILTRANEKLKLTDRIIEKGGFAVAGPSTSKTSLISNLGQLQDILKFGVNELFKDENEDEEADFSRLLGATIDGEWQTESSRAASNDYSFDSETDDKVTQNIYVFEGQDYSKLKDTTIADKEAFEILIELEKETRKETALGERSLRGKGTSLLSDTMPEVWRKPRKQLTREEIEALRKKRQEAAEWRAQRAAEKKERKRDELWKRHKYVSANITIESEGEEEEEEEEDEDVDRPTTSIQYVIGDVTHPVDVDTDGRVIVHCADDSGHWGRGGMFSAISARSSKPREQYELAGKMKDLNLGDCHLVSLQEENEDCKDFLALIIAQTRDRKNNLSGIKLPAFKEGLDKVYSKAHILRASVHLPRIGHDTPSFNWYGTERLIHKILASKGIPTYIYYFSRKQNLKRKQNGHSHQAAAKVSRHNSSDSDSISTTSGTPLNSSLVASRQRSPNIHMSPSTSTAPTLPELFTGVAIHLYNVDSDKMTKYKRYIIAYDGDVDAYVHDKTTHLVAPGTTDKEDLKKVLGGHKTCCVVNTCWLEDCLKEGQLLPKDKYIIDLL